MFLLCTLFSKRNRNTIFMSIYWPNTIQKYFARVRYVNHNLRFAVTNKPRPEEHHTRLRRLLTRAIVYDFLRFNIPDRMRIFILSSEFTGRHTSCVRRKDAVHCVRTTYEIRRSYVLKGKKMSCPWTSRCAEEISTFELVSDLGWVQCSFGDNEDEERLSC